MLVVPAIFGMLDTLTSKCKAEDLADHVLKAKPAVVKTLSKKVVSGWSKNFFKSKENMLRSLNVYYCHDVMGKAKYISIRKANKGCTNTPNYVPYPDLAKYMRELDIGIVKDVSDFAQGVDESVLCQGMYRPLDVYLPRLAEFYLKVNENRKDKLKFFPDIKKIDNASKMFLFTFGGDGAPICGTIFLTSFLNVGNRIASSSENFMIFGSDVTENSKIVRNFVLKVVSDIKYLESKVFDIVVADYHHKVEFRLKEIPNDMKMLAFLAGELSNASYYFSTFANVNQQNCNDFKKRIGNDWIPFDYEKRLKDYRLVQTKKAELAKSKTKEATQRSNLTSYISQTLKSRQEDMPLIGPYVDCAKSEPLHLKNNTCKELFIKLFKICISQSNLKNIKSFKDIKSNQLFAKFVAFVRSNMGCNFLGNKISAWFNENSGAVEKDFTFRFRGKESLGYIQHFPKLIEMILDEVTNEQIKLRLHQIFYQSLNHRHVISLSVRIEDFNCSDLTNLKNKSALLFKACCIFDQKISPSLWTLSNALSYHAEKTFKDYGFGLGCNTMEGREQKHQRIQKYATKTTFQCRWPLIFRHQFIHLIYLRENGFDTICYRKRFTKYIPEIEQGFCETCSSDLMKDNNCKICDSVYMKKVEEKLDRM